MVCGGERWSGSPPGDVEGREKPSLHGWMVEPWIPCGNRVNYMDVPLQRGESLAATKCWAAERRSAGHEACLAGGVLSSA